MASLPAYYSGCTASNARLISSSAKEAFTRKSEPINTVKPERMTPSDSVELLRRYSEAKPVDSAQKNVIATDLKTDEKAGNSLVYYKIVGEAFDCYVLVQTEDAFLIIDKHAAHERILFEDLKRAEEHEGKISSQSLMLPITVILSAEEFSAISEYKEDIKSVGFEFNLNNGAVDLVAVPGNISISAAEELLIKMLDEIVEGKGNPAITDAIRKEKALYQIACKAAIKGGRVYDRAIIEWLVRRVIELPDITVCPHGRPIAYRLTKTELDRQFERIK